MIDRISSWISINIFTNSENVPNESFNLRGEGEVEKKENRKKQDYFSSPFQFDWKLVFSLSEEGRVAKRRLRISRVNDSCIYYQPCDLSRGKLRHGLNLSRSTTSSSFLAYAWAREPNNSKRGMSRRDFIFFFFFPFPLRRWVSSNTIGS